MTVIIEGYPYNHMNPNMYDNCPVSLYHQPEQQEPPPKHSPEHLKSWRERERESWYIVIKDILYICLNRFIGLMCELLWSNPQTALGRAPSKRGCGIKFGEDVTRKFLTYNHLDLIVRSHEVKDEGFEFTHNDQLITIFSAPNYCDMVKVKTFSLSLPFWLLLC